MSKTQLPQSILNGTFLMICSGETYFTEIVPGARLLERMFVAMYGPDENNWPAGEKQSYAEDLANPDEWGHDSDYGPVWFKTDVGETDHIELKRITCPILPEASPISRLFAAHAKLIEDGNHYAYFEMAYTRATMWMAWLCTNSREADPERKVLACGQGHTPEEACANALAKMKADHV